jgi:hypothetical protein
MVGSSALLFLLLVPAAQVAPPPSVGLEVTSSGQMAAVYRVEVRNDTSAATDVVVRQNIPRGTNVSANTPGGTQDAGEVWWRLHLESRESREVSTAFTPPPNGQTYGAACAYVDPSATAVDCAAARWTSPSPIATSAPWWRRWQVLAAAGLLLVLATAVLVSRRRRAAPAAASHRRGPPTWTVVALSAVVLLGLGVGAAAVAAPRLTALAGGGPSGRDGWIGAAPQGLVGQSLRENALAFTTYRIVCTPPNDAAAAHQCTTVVGVTNPGGAAERWYPAMQRLETADGGWVPVDEAATVTANGADLFGDPLPPGGTVLAQLVFNLPPGSAATRLELRSGAFSEGARVQI